jgi:signal transduction histidine kinase/CheY-like chemotaxis protein
MKWKDLQTESVKLQWNFYERTINNYSIIMRIMSSAEDDLLVSHVPRVFVEESFFDMCKIMIDDDGIIREGFYSIDETLSSLDYTSVATLNGNSTTASLIDDVFGYGILYIYPLRRELKTIGYLVLGKRYYMDVELRLLRELEIVCDIYNRSLLLGGGTDRRKGFRPMVTFETVLEVFPDPLLLVDKKGYICYANRNAKAQFETRKGFLLGERADRAIPGLPEDLVKKNRPFRGEINYKSQNDYKMFRVESFAVNEEKGTGEWRAILFKDVAKMKVSEEEHLVKKRTESVGMLAGGIAHDFNNMLTGILGYAALMRKMLTDPKLCRYAEAIEHSAQRASQLTRHLLNFSRRQKKSNGLVDINSLLDDVLFLLKESFFNIRIERDLDLGLPNIKGDEAELQNVFLNLFINAKDAMDGEGLLRVTTSRRDGGFVCIEIEDTGKGIDQAMQHKIFEPYFSTKEDLSNLGMGLYLVDKVVKEHGGFIEIASEKQKGTIFRLYMPVPSMRVSERRLKETPHASQNMDGRTILIVDDEHMVRELLKGVLAEAGATLLEAENGEDALQIYVQKQDEIDLVILDVIMPGMKGDEVLRRIRKARSNMKVIISSGFMSEEQRAKLKEYKVDGFLDKPFKDDDALAVVAEVLESNENR